MTADWKKELSLIASAKMSPQQSGLTESVYLSPPEVLNAAKRLYDHGYFIEDLSVLDTSEGFMVVYHLDHYQTPGRIALRVLVPQDKAEIPSISGIFSGADWHERECHDFFGVVFTGHPNLVPLLLPEDSTIHPLVKAAEERKRVAELMAPGEVEISTPEFDALFSKPEQETEVKKPLKEKAPHKETGSSSEE
jgi:NADH-quinone oxidoreductase subunit C